MLFRVLKEETPCQGKTLCSYSNLAIISITQNLVCLILDFNIVEACAGLSPNSFSMARFNIMGWTSALESQVCPSENVRAVYLVDNIIVSTFNTMITKLEALEVAV